MQEMAYRARLSCHDRAHTHHNIAVCPWAASINPVLGIPAFRDMSTPPQTTALRKAPAPCINTPLWTLGTDNKAGVPTY